MNFVLWSSFVYGQNLENLKNQTPVHLSGSLSMQAQVYRVSGIDPRQQPFYGMVSGSPTLSIYGIRIPFFILLSNQERRFQQPFNQIGIAPSYKWVKAYLGYNNVHFSNYTLAGRRFLGVGTELTPGPFRIGVIYGKFQRAIAEDTTRQQTGEGFLSAIPIPAYDRKGYALKLGAGNTRNFIDLLLLKAKDDQKSLVSSTINPEENLALGITWQVTLFKRLRWKTDAGISAFTRNQESDSIALPPFPGSGFLQRLFPPRFSSQLRSAVESNLALDTKPFGLTLGYKRIDKDYKSMGAYYFLTDIEQITIGPSLSLLKNRFRLNGQLGLQRNNLDQTQAHTTRRVIGSANLSFQPNQKFGLTAQYANFGLTQNPVQRSITDTTLLEQVSQNLTIVPRLLLASGENIQTLTLILGYHALSDQGTSISASPDMRTWFSNLNYTITLPKKGWNINTSLNGQRVQLSQGLTERLGFGVGCTKAATSGRLSGNLAYTFFTNWFERMPNGHTQIITAGTTWRVHDQHSFQLYLRHLINHARIGHVDQGFDESQGRVGYLFHFN